MRLIEDLILFNSDYYAWAYNYLTVTSFINAKHGDVSVESFS